jgi:hypothetical protein
MSDYEGSDSVEEFDQQEFFKQFLNKLANKCKAKAPNQVAKALYDKYSSVFFGSAYMVLKEVIDPDVFVNGTNIWASDNCVDILNRLIPVMSSAHVIDERKPDGLKRLHAILQCFTTEVLPVFTEDGLAKCIIPRWAIFIFAMSSASPSLEFLNAHESLETNIQACLGEAIDNSDSNNADSSATAIQEALQTMSDEDLDDIAGSIVKTIAPFALGFTSAFRRQLERLAAQSGTQPRAHSAEERGVASAANALLLSTPPPPNKRPRHEGLLGDSEEPLALNRSTRDTSNVTTSPTRGHAQTSTGPSITNVQSTTPTSTAEWAARVQQIAPGADDSTNAEITTGESSSSSSSIHTPGKESSNGQIWAIIDSLYERDGNIACDTLDFAAGYAPTSVLRLLAAGQLPLVNIRLQGCLRGPASMRAFPGSSPPLWGFPDTPFGMITELEDTLPSANVILEGEEKGRVDRAHTLITNLKRLCAMAIPAAHGLTKAQLALSWWTLITNLWTLPLVRCFRMERCNLLASIAGETHPTAWWGVFPAHKIRAALVEIYGLVSTIHGHLCTPIMILASESHSLSNARSRHHGTGTPNAESVDMPIAHPEIVGMHQRFSRANGGRGDGGRGNADGFRQRQRGSRGNGGRGRGRTGTHPQGHQGSSHSSSPSPRPLN